MLPLMPPQGFDPCWFGEFCIIVGWGFGASLSCAIRRLVPSPRSSSSLAIAFNCVNVNMILPLRFLLVSCAREMEGSPNLVLYLRIPRVIQRSTNSCVDLFFFVCFTICAGILLLLLLVNLYLVRVFHVCTTCVHWIPLFCHAGSW
jgi:hypothetical protein